MSLLNFFYNVTELNGKVWNQYIKKQSIKTTYIHALWVV